MANKWRMVNFFGGFPLRVGALMALAFHVMWTGCLVYWASAFLAFSVVWEHETIINNPVVAEISLIGGMYAVEAVFAVISAIILAIGISTNKSTIVLIWTIFDVIQMVSTSSVIIWILYLSKDHLTALFLGSVVVKIYFWFVALSFYCELRVSYPPQPTGHSRLT